jgi:hypothetical protein
VRPSRLVVAAVAAVAVPLAGCAGESGPGAREGTPSRSTGAATATSKPAANGLADLPADQIFQKAGVALQKARSLRLTFRGTDAGQAFNVDMRIQDNRGAVGTVSMEGATFALLRIGSTAYLKGDAKTWQQMGGAEVAKVLAGKWIKMPVTQQDFRDFVDFASIGFYAKLFSTAETGFGTADVERTELRGVSAVKVSDETGSALYVAAEGEPYPLRLAGVPEKGDKDGPFTLDFAEFGKPVPLATPPASQVLDIDKLGR